MNDNKFIDSYVNWCKNKDLLYTEIDNIKNNTAMKKLSLMFQKKISVEPDKYGNILLKLLENDDIRVKLVAANHLLKINKNVEDAIGCIKVISESNEYPLVAFEAKCILEYCVK